MREFIYPAMYDPPPVLAFDDQFAFRPGGSCTAAIIAILQTISEMLLDNPFVVLISLDFSKAFDTVRHSTLTEKLSLLSMPDSVYNWIVGYFMSHEHCTVFDNSVSSFRSVNSSVIQGSSLGPSSYAVAGSDLRPCVIGNKMFKFADDFDMIIPACNVDSRAVELQHVEEWSTANNLRLNCSKSREIVFYKPRSRAVVEVPEIPGVLRVTTIKLLGVTIQNKFSMEEHVSDVITSSARALYGLRILRSHGLSSGDLRTVFRATVLSKLLYASPAWWGFANVQQRDRLEGFLRKATRAGFFDGSTTFPELCCESDKTFFHDIIRDSQHPLQFLLPAKTQKTYNMRQRSHDFQLPIKHNSLFERNFLIRIFYDGTLN